MLLSSLKEKAVQKEEGGSRKDSDAIFIQVYFRSDWEGGRRLQRGFSRDAAFFQSGSMQKE